ncbi:MAG: NapC/NirT family cytochrome c [bacterium]|nr:NapC/NirT family cytochrome c [bacterium]
MNKFSWIVKEFFAACWETIKLPFWLFGVGWKRLIGFGPRRIGLVLFASSIVIVFSLLFFVKVTSQPSFCRSCHVMEPYFAAWETSTHHNVTCTECHIPPGLEGTVHSKFLALSMVANYFTGVYKRSKPWAEIEDANCLRQGCHDTRLLQSTEDFRGVKFDHKPHLEQIRRGKQLRCTSCHSNIVQGEHITVNESTCFTCHFKPDSVGAPTALSGCTKCHNPPTGTMAADTSFDHTQMLARHVDCQSCHASEVVGDGFVPRERCNSCHSELQHIERYDDHEFVHQKHVTDRKVECTACHIQIRHGKEAVAFAGEQRRCSECHGGPDDAVERVWRGDLPGLPLAPSTMARAGMDCESCHVGEIHAMTRGGQRSEPVCTPCHDANYDKLWARWDEPLNRRVKELKGRLGGLEPSLRDTMLRALDIYEAGNPLHNPALIEHLAARISGQPAGSGTSCSSCHPAAGDAVVQRSGQTFDHRKHTAAIKCEECHATGSDRHGQIVMPDAKCNSCHHQPLASGKPKCESCHTTQAAVFNGNIPVFAGATPSFKKELDFACTDCHETSGALVTREVTPLCIGCHDETFADTLRGWQTGARDLNQAIHAAQSHYRVDSERYRQYQQLADWLSRDGSGSAHNPQLYKRWFESIGAAQ